MNTKSANKPESHNKPKLVHTLDVINLVDKPNLKSFKIKKVHKEAKKAAIKALWRTVFCGDYCK